LLPYNPEVLLLRFGLLPFRSPLLRKYIFVSSPPGTEMFHFPGYASYIIKMQIIEVYSTGFPHSEISGSKVAKHLPEAYRSNATSFFATFSQGIHRTPLNFLLRNLKITIVFRLRFSFLSETALLIRNCSILVTIKRPRSDQIALSCQYSSLTYQTKNRLLGGSDRQKKSLLGPAF
jgi:hypothetical protein